MIRWCAFCQRFQGEFPPFNRREVSHGICTTCASFGLDWSPEQEKVISYLTDLNHRLWNAGRRGDPEEMKTLAKEGFKAGIRPIDMLFGFAGPLLVQVGELWESNELTVAQEHDFTHACESLIDLVAAQTQVRKDDQVPPNLKKILLSNVPDNQHTLGVRFASLGLAGIGVESRIVDWPSTSEKILSEAITGGYELVGLSISSSDQAPQLQTALDSLLSSSAYCGQILVGGVAVNEGFVLKKTPPRVHWVARPTFDQSELNWFIR